MAPKTKAAAQQPSLITAVSQQSRFHTETLDTSLEIDLKGVTISIGERELIASSHLRFKNGVRYGLVGRNGSGKSTLLTAIAERLIPGLNPSIRILLLSQVEDSARATEQISGEAVNVLEHVVKGDKERQTAMMQFEVLTKAVETTSIRETQRIVYQLRVEKRQLELQEARKVASRRSGARGKVARQEEITAEENLKKAEELLAHIDEAEIESDIVNQALEMLQQVQLTLDLLETESTEARAAMILAGLGFSQEMMQGPYTSLSGGWRSRCSLATSLLVQSDVLLLDEPSNFLDLEAIIWLEGFLSSQSRTLVLISHDQAFLNNVVEETIILRNNKLEYFEGTPAAFEVAERKKAKHLTGMQEAQDRKREHIEKSIQQGISSAKKTGDENRQKMVKSRQKKLDERWGMERSAKGTRFKLQRDMAEVGYSLTNRLEIEKPTYEPPVKIKIENPEKLRTIGDLLHFDAVEFQFPRAKKPFLEGITFTVNQGGRCAFVGANGQGKSTIAKLIMGKLQPTKGTITRHPLLKIGYFSQHSVEELSTPQTFNSLGPVTALSYFMRHFEDKGEKVIEQDARRCLGSFGLQGKVASDTPLVQLSGGQKVRLALALIVFIPPPLLLLDEVTTHVDFPTIRALAQALKVFTGAIIIITHDRWFSRVIIERESLRHAEPEDSEGEDDPSSSEEEDDVSVKQSFPGKTYRVGGGKLKEMERGMAQYVALVERKLARQKNMKT
ncbi:Iron complex transport system ATP-binding protein [Mycena indigotica]|uniref:Iron complex transport system ATP-binding protein n=1 Tax=Mycena indigotica TaxID=2126181 RepID=A0A8H6W1Y5_9AGAR|nr:Iron complex transport system ATP-binding protein [Mycena indigotica]KAF7302027.1 Iron complex transport system ATP-binding protein [Mycena indigotica]